jgi:hypothetical protein
MKNFDLDGGTSSRLKNEKTEVLVATVCGIIFSQILENFFENILHIL